MLDKLCILNNNMKPSFIVKTYDCSMGKYIYDKEDAYSNAYGLYTDRSLDKLDEVLALNDIGDLLYENVFSIFTDSTMLPADAVLAIEALLNNDVTNPIINVSEITLKNIDDIDANKLSFLNKLSNNCIYLIIDYCLMSKTQDKNSRKSGFEKIVRELYMNYSNKWIYFVFANFNDINSKEYTDTISKYFFNNTFVTKRN